MELSLKDFDISDLVRKAVADTLIAKLDRVLPRLLEDILTKKASYGGEDIVSKAIRAAVTAELEIAIHDYMEKHKGHIRDCVATVMHHKMSPDFIATCLLSGLENIKVPITPFKISKNTDDDDL